jgi:hypothetical protein
MLLLAVIPLAVVVVHAIRNWGNEPYHRYCVIGGQLFVLPLAMLAFFEYAPLEWRSGAVLIYSGANAAVILLSSGGKIHRLTDLHLALTSLWLFAGTEHQDEVERLRGFKRKYWPVGLVWFVLSATLFTVSLIVSFLMDPAPL